MKKIQTQNEDKKKKRKILLACLIPTGVAALATAITLPLVLNKNNIKVYTEVTEEEWVAAFNKIDYMSNETANLTFELNEKVIDTEEPEPLTSSEQFFVAQQKYKRVGKSDTDFGAIKHQIHFPLKLNNGRYRYYLEYEDPAKPSIEFIKGLKDKYSSSTCSSSNKMYIGTASTEKYEDFNYQVGFSADKNVEKIIITAKMTDTVTITFDYSFTNIDSTTIGDWPTDKIDNNIITSTKSSHTWTSETVANMSPGECFIFEFDFVSNTNNTINIISDSSALTKNTITSSKAFIMQPNKTIATDVETAAWSTDTSLRYGYEKMINGYLYIEFYPNDITATNVQVTIVGEE